MEQVTPTWKPKYIVISIDGGGIRGLIPGLLLEEIEKSLPGYDTNIKIGLIHKHVDMMAGFPLEESFRLEFLLGLMLRSSATSIKMNTKAFLNGIF